jgi:hypothetical protein
LTLTDGITWTIAEFNSSFSRQINLHARAAE